MLKKQTGFALITTLFLFLFTITTFAQKTRKNPIIKIKAKAANVEIVTLKHKSDVLKREMSYRVILPLKYNVNKQRKYPVLYLLHGLSGDFKDWSDKTKLAEYLEKYDLIVVMPDAHNSWYTNSISAENNRYESYIIEEMIPKVDKDFRTNSNREGRIIAGLSMGGYGSLKFGLKYPEKFVLAGSFSGALRAAEFDGRMFGGWKVLGDSITQTYGDLNSKVRTENNIYKILESKPRGGLAKLPYFYLDCGTEDSLIKQNQDFAKLLMEQKVPHEYRQLPGKHNWKFWNSQIEEFLEITQKFIAE